MTTNVLCKKITVLATVCWCLTPVESRAEFLRAELWTPVLRVGEPLVVQVTLIKDSSISNHQEPEQHRGHRRPQNLDAILYDGEAIVARAMLAGGRLTYNTSATESVTGTFMGILGTFTTLDGGSASFKLWTTPGQYEVTIAFEDRTEPRSERLPVRIIALPADENGLIRELEAIGIDLPWAIYGMPHRASSLESLKGIAQRYSDTFLGPYARAAILLAKTRELDSGADVLAIHRDESHAEELRATAESFTPGHPLRNHLLLDAADLKLRIGQRDPALEVLEILYRETEDTWYRASVQKRLGVSDDN